VEIKLLTLRKNLQNYSMIDEWVFDWWLQFAVCLCWIVIWASYMKFWGYCYPLKNLGGPALLSSVNATNVHNNALITVGSSLN